jgi:EmrB/QacA subfamily drug resistance transporter
VNAMVRTRTPDAPAPQAASRRWTALAFISLAQLMIALDATIVNIALPSAQAALGASSADRQWVVTAYTLAFGGLLLAGGRAADLLGRKPAFLIGLAGFAVASALGGAAPNFAVLIGARALQGAFAALLAPAALSLVATSFSEPKQRATAFAVYGSIAGSGAAIGFLLGGALTQYLAWRWCLYVNVPIALAAGVGGWLVLPKSARRGAGAVDLAGLLLASAGLVTLVFGSVKVVELGWRSPIVLDLFGISAAALGLFVWREATAKSPLLPLRVLADRSRSGVYLMVALVIAGMFGAYLLLTYYLQSVLRYTPLEAGLAFLPMTVASQSASWLIARRLVPLVAPRVLMVPGVLVAASGVALLAQLHVGSGYLGLVLPAEMLLGAGISCAMVPAFNTATQRLDPRDAGVASATVTAAQQIGSSLGTAVLNTVATTATASFLAAHAGEAHSGAVVAGFASAAGVAALILVAGALVALVLVSSPRPARS